jgi:hypothetical protein
MCLLNDRCYVRSYFLPAAAGTSLASVLAAVSHGQTSATISTRVGSFLLLGDPVLAGVTEALHSPPSVEVGNWSLESKRRTVHQISRVTNNVKAFSPITKRKSLRFA